MSAWRLGVCGILAAILFAGSPAHAAHPLITEDTGTQGEGRWQLEANIERTRDRTDDGTARAILPAATLAYGFAENADVQVTYSHFRQTLAGSRIRGPLDAAIEVKWRFHEDGPLSLALMPGVTLATGREEEGLGTGRSTWGSRLIVSWQQEAWALHSHAGYVHNRNVLGQRRSLWHLSAALWVKAGEALNVVIDGSLDTDPERSGKAVRQGIVGLIYSVSPDLDLDVGYRRGNAPAVDHAILAGVTVRW